jgi:hypothetical protein
VDEAAEQVASAYVKSVRTPNMCSLGFRVTTCAYDGTIHDFMLLNPLSETQARAAAIREAIAQLRPASGNAS